MAGRTPPVDDEVEDDVESETDHVETEDVLEEGDEGDESEGEGAEDPEGEGEPDDDGPAEEVDEPPARQPSRAAARFEKLARENRELKERLDKVEKRDLQPAGPSAADIERARAEQQRRDDEELERAALEGPVAVGRVARAQAERSFGQHLQQDRFRQADRDDRSDFRSECREVPAYAKIADRVEAELAKYRANGNNPSRIAIANFLIGQDAVARAKGAATRQGKKAGAKVAREAAPARRGTRSDVGGGRRRGGGDDVEAFERRYGNVNI